MASDLTASGDRQHSAGIALLSTPDHPGPMPTSSALDVAPTLPQAHLLPSPPARSGTARWSLRQARGDRQHGCPTRPLRALSAGIALLSTPDHPGPMPTSRALDVAPTLPQAHLLPSPYARSGTARWSLRQASGPPWSTKLTKTFDVFDEFSTLPPFSPVRTLVNVSGVTILPL